MIKKYKQFINEGLLDKLQGPNKEEVTSNIKQMFDEGKIDIFEYYKKARELNIPGPTKEEIDSRWDSIVRNGVKPKYLLDNAMKLGLFNGVLKAFEENEKLLRYGNTDTINIYYISFKDLNNFNDKEADYIIDKFLNEYEYDDVFFKSMEGNYFYGVKKVLEPTEEIKNSKKYQDFLEDKDYYINKSLLNISANVDTYFNDNFNTDILKLILESAGKKLKIPTKLINYSSEEGYLEIVKILVEHGVDIHQNKFETPINYASENGHLDVVKYLVEHGADIHERDEHPLHVAARGNHFEIVKYLVEQGSDIHGSKEYPLGVSIYCNYYEQAKYLLEIGSNIENVWDTFFNKVIKEGTSEMKKLLNKYLPDDKKI